MKTLLFALLFTTSSSAFAANTTTIECSLGNGNDEYSIVLTPSDDTWPTSAPEGSIRIDFAGYRIGRLFLGSYVNNPNSPLEFAAVTDGDASTVMGGTITNLDSNKPVLLVKTGPNFVAKKRKAIPCTKL